MYNLGKTYSVKELAEALEISEETVRDIIRLKRIAYHRVGGQARGRIRIAESDLQAFLQRSRVAAVDE